MTYLLVSLGAIAGGLTRYQIDRIFPTSQSGFPLTTLAINVTGSFLIGLLAGFLPERSDMRLLLMTGFCGAYTTFSTYSLEIVRLLQAGHWTTAITYLGLSAVLAPALCFVGYLMTR